MLTKAPTDWIGIASSTERWKTLKAQSMSRTRRPKSPRTSAPQPAAITRRSQRIAARRAVAGHDLELVGVREQPSDLGEIELEIGVAEEDETRRAPR